MKSLINLNKNSMSKMTLEEIQNSADKVIITKNQLKIQKKTDNQIITIQIDSYPDGQVMNFGKINIPNKKADLEETVLMMLKKKCTQKDISFKLGISQTLVSNIKRKNLK